MHETHELVHVVAVKPGRAKRVLGDQPTRRKDHEIAISGAGGVARCRQYGEDRRVGVIEADTAQRIEAGEIVNIGRVIAVPGDDVERRMVELGCPEIALKLGDNVPGQSTLAAPTRAFQCRPRFFPF